MKKTLLTFISSMTLASSAFAMISPSYMTVKVIDAAVEEMAEKMFSYEDAEEAPIASIEVLSKGIQVTINNTSCLVTITRKPLPPGAAGSPGVIAKISDEKRDCQVIREDLKTVTYDKVLQKLDRAAKLGKIVQKVSVTNSGKIKIISQK